jgi:hypothetical protein
VAGAVIIGPNPGQSGGVTSVNGDQGPDVELDAADVGAADALALLQETNDREAVDAGLDGRLDLIEGLGPLATSGDLAAEATTRAAADTALDGRLDDIEALGPLATAVALAGETAAREGADTALDSRLDAIETLGPLATAVDLSAEATTRGNADAALDARLDTVEGELPLKATVVALTGEAAARQAGDDAAADALQAHIDTAVGAHPSSAISTPPVGALSGTDVETQLEELLGLIGGGGYSDDLARSAVAAVLADSATIAWDLTDPQSAMVAAVVLGSITVAHLAFDPATQGELDVETAARIAADALAIPLTQKGAANGVANLDAGGLIPAGLLPALAITEVSVVADEAARLALTAQPGDVAIQTDDGTTWILAGPDPTDPGDWVQFPVPAGVVLTVNGQAGPNVSLPEDGPAATPSLRTLGTGAAQAAPGNDARLSNARTPTAHAASHADGGTDELALDGSQITTGTVADARIAATIARDSEVTAAVAAEATARDTAIGVAVAAIPTDGPAGTASLRTLGTAGTQAAAGNDARLSDARTPTAHAASHADGGTDEVALDASQITTGTLADARIPSAITRDTELSAAIAGEVSDRNAAIASSAAGLQPLDAQLTAVAALTPGADQGVYFTSLTAAALFDLSAFARTLLDDANASTARSTLGLVIGTNVQAQSAVLALLAGLTPATDRLPYFDSAGTAALATFTAFARSLVDDANAAAALTTLGVTAFVQTLLDDTTAAAFLTTLGVSTFIQTLLDDVDAATARGTLGLGTAAVVNTGTSAGNVPTITQADARYSAKIDTIGTGLATTGTVTIDFTALANTKQQITLTGNPTFASSNLIAGAGVTVRLLSNGSARTLAWPANWKPLGGLSALPTSLASGKEATFTAYSWGTTDANVQVAYSVQG